MKQVTKRDGRVVEFDSSRIFKAVDSAYNACNIEHDDYNIQKVVALVTEKLDFPTSVEEIQDLVEESLMRFNPKVARAYIIYREERSKARLAKQDAVYDSIVNVESNDITKENANIDAATPAGQMMKFASENTKAYALRRIVPRKFAKLHKQGWIHMHDLDYYPTKSLTCVQHPLDWVFKNGISNGHGTARPPHRIESAVSLAAISIQNVQNVQHGGQAIPAFDFYLAPFVKTTYDEELEKLCKVAGIQPDHDYPSDYIVTDKLSLTVQQRVKQLAINNTVKRVHQAMEAFLHDMNMQHSRGGAQVPFSSINYGTDTSPEGRCIIRETLLSTIEGVGNGETAIFPIQIWKLKKGVSAEPGDPNYDLLQIAAEATSKRFFPNYVNLDASYNVDSAWKSDDPKRYEHEVATMGCLRKGTKVVMADASLREVQDVHVGDWLMGTEGPVQVIQLVRGTAPMYEISSKTGMTYAVNGKHLLHLRHCHPEPRYGTKPGDEIDITVEEALTKSKTWFNCYYGYQSGYDCAVENCALDPYILGLWLGDGVRSEPVLAVNRREMAIADAWIAYGKDLGLDHTVINGFDGCLKVRLTDHNKGSKNAFMQLLYEHDLCCNKHIPESYFRMSRVQRLRLLAGLLDTDGCYASNRFVFSNTNRQLIDGVMRLARSLGYHASISEVKSSSVIKGKTYNVATCWNVGISGEISELNQYTLIKKDTAVKHNKATQSAIRITPVGVEDYYGFVLTGNHLFMLEDGTVTHNCRTRVYENINGPKTSIGRGNLSFTTINLPRLAIISSGNKTKFFAELDKMCDAVAEQLHVRLEFQKTARKKQFPQLMDGMWVGSDSVAPEDQLGDVLEQGTLAIGFIGLAECLTALVGSHHGQSQEAQELGLQIVGRIHAKCQDYKEKYHHNYGCFATPAEGLSGRFTKLDRKKFGTIPGVTDKDYYTNSSHIPVGFNISISEKLRLEGAYHKIEPAGHIAYVELDSAYGNPKAIESALRIATAYDCGYISVNFNDNFCLDCGHHWQSRDTKTCPKCGSHNVDTLARITGLM